MIVYANYEHVMKFVNRSFLQIVKKINIFGRRRPYRSFELWCLSHCHFEFDIYASRFLFFCKLKYITELSCSFKVHMISVWFSIIQIVLFGRKIVHFLDTFDCPGKRYVVNIQGQMRLQFVLQEYTVSSVDYPASLCCTKFPDNSFLQESDQWMTIMIAFQRHYWDVIWVPMLWCSRLEYNVVAGSTIK